MGGVQKTEDVPAQIFESSTSQLRESITEPATVNEFLQTGELPAPQIIRTLPHNLNSMIGESIDVETDRAQELIGLLGRKLGIEDYQTNMAAFWLLDTIALEIIRNKEKLSPDNLGIMVSWIAGEAKLIQEKNCSRVEFFREMNSIFDKVPGLLDKGQTMMYWEELAGVNKPFQIEEQQQSEGEYAFEPASEPLRLADSHEFQKRNNFENAPVMFDSVEQYSGSHASNSTEVRHRYYSIPQSSTHVLEAIVESTYSVYANAFHYATISAALAHPIEICAYQLPYTLRFPTSVKPPVTVTTQIEGAPGKAKTKSDGGKLGKNGEKEKSKSKSRGGSQPSPSPMADEEVMDGKRRLILPLMESNEAVHLLNQLTQLQSIESTTGTSVEKKTTKKGKRK